MSENESVYQRIVRKEYWEQKHCGSNCISDQSMKGRQSGV